MRLERWNSWALVALLLGSAAGATWLRPTDHATELTRPEALEDIEDFQERLMAVHPDPHRSVAASELERQFAKAKASLPETVSPELLFQVLAPIAAAVRDSHTSLAPPRAEADLVLPLRVHGDEIRLARALHPLPAASRVLRVDGHSAASVLGLVRSFASAEHPAAVDVVLPGLIPFARRLLGLSPHRAVLEVVTPDGIEMRAVITKHTVQSTRTPAVESGVFPNGVIYLRLDTMAGDLQEHRDYLSEFFAWVAEVRPPGLIIDLRENDGGNTQVGSTLLSYLTARPHRIFGQKRWRVSRYMQERVREMGRWSEPYLAASPGSFLRESPPVDAPAAIEHAFAGPSVLLIGPRTRSAAMMTANAARDFDLAPVLGEPTTSSPNFFGESYRYWLPNSRLRASISSAEFIRANGDALDRGPVIPHANLSDEDGIVSPQDEVVAVAIALIERHQTLAKAGDGELAARVPLAGSPR
ncbi:MAG: S41 family peptidase [Myxococcota bacterium]